jgi:hypothetical protein
VAKHLPAVADPVERTDSDVETIHEEAEPGKEAEHERPRDARGRGDSPHQNRNGDTDQWPGPHDRERTRILGEIGPGDCERMQNNLCDFSACEPCADDMPELVHRLHPEPGAIIVETISSA